MLGDSRVKGKAMTTKARCESLAKELNVEIDINKGRDYDINLSTPKGFMFGTLCHASTTETETMKDAWVFIWEELQGVVPCDADKCENC